MINALSGTQFWWIFVIVIIFVIIGVVVFVLRKKIPGLTNYERKDEKEEAEDNLNRYLSSTEEENKIKNLNKDDEDE